MSRSFPRLAAAVLTLGLSMPFACKCPSSTPAETAPVDNKVVRKIDLNKRKALNLRQARRLTPADKLHMPVGTAAGAAVHGSVGQVSGAVVHQPSSAPVAP